VYAVSHPVETAKSIWKSISDSWENDVINGDAKSRSQWFGRAIGEVALAIIGTKGVDKAVKMAKGAKVVEEAGGVRVVKPVPAEKLAEKGSSEGKAFSRGEDPSTVSNLDKRLDHVPILRVIEVRFNHNAKHDAEEFARQLRLQEEGMNKLTIEEYLRNRERYIKEGRAFESKAVQQAARERAYINKYEELRDSGLSYQEAKKQATKWLDTQAALHNPDMIAGGNPLIIGGMGDKGVNSSIGSQWRYRIDAIDEEIRKAASNMTQDQLRDTYLNIKLKH
jgi:predicted ribonuclease toxin of YeeF-YezG toxin-antitoxin module